MLPVRPASAPKATSAAVTVASSISGVPSSSSTSPAPCVAITAASVEARLATVPPRKSAAP